MDAGEIINRCFLFFDLDMNFARDLYTCFEEKNFRIGEDVFQSGDIGDALYILGQGGVKITSVDSKGKSQVVAELIEGDVIGEMAIVTGKVRSGKCTFTSNGKLLVLTLDKYNSMRRSSPRLYLAITRNIARIISARLAAMTEKVTSLLDGIHSAEDKQINLESEVAKGKVGLMDFLGLSKRKVVKDIGKGGASPFGLGVGGKKIVDLTKPSAPKKEIETIPVSPDPFGLRRKFDD